MAFWKSIPRPFLWFILLLYAVTFLFFFKDATAQTKDSTEYFLAAQNLLENGHWYAGDTASFRDPAQVDYRLFSKRPPAYPLFLLLVPNERLVLFFQILASLFGLALGYRLMFPEGIRTPSVSFWWIAAILIILSPAQWYYSGFVMSDLLLQTFVMLGLFFYGKWRYDRTHRWLWFSAMCLSMALMLKPVMLPFVFLLAVLGLFFAIRTRTASLLIYLLPLLFWAGISFRNQHYSGQFEYSSIGAINAVQYNSRVVLSRVLGSDSAEKVLLPYMYIPHNALEYARWKAESKALGTMVLREYPWQSIKQHLMGSFRMPFDPGRFEWALLFDDPTPEEGGLLESFNQGGFGAMCENVKTHKLGLLLLLLIPVYGMRWFLFLLFIWFNRNNHLILLCFGLVLYFILITGPIGASRFLIPVLPLLIWGAAGAIEQGINRLQQR